MLKKTISFIVLFAIIFVTLELERHGIIMIENVIAGVISSIVTCIAVWFFSFRKLPEKVKIEIDKGIKDQSTLLSFTEQRICKNFDKAGNLSNEHTGLSEQSEKIYEDTQFLKKEKEFELRNSNSLKGTSISQISDLVRKHEKELADYIQQIKNLQEENHELKKNIEQEQKPVLKHRN